MVRAKSISISSKRGTMNETGLVERAVVERRSSSIESFSLYVRLTVFQVSQLGLDGWQRIISIQVRTHLAEGCWFRLIIDKDWEIWSQFVVRRMSKGISKYERDGC